MKNAAHGPGAKNHTRKHSIYLPFTKYKLLIYLYTNVLLLLFKSYDGFHQITSFSWKDNLLLLFVEEKHANYHLPNSNVQITLGRIVWHYDHAAGNWAVWDYAGIWNSFIRD